MTKSVTRLEEFRAIMEFERLNIKSMIKGFIESPELTSQVNKMSDKEKKVSNSDIDKLAKTVIQKKFDYLISKYKIKTTDDYSKVIEKIPDKEISKITLDICKKVIEENS